MQKLIKLPFSIILFLTVFTNVANAQEERIKALFIYNFTKYIEWPDEFKKGDFVIAILGETPIFDQLVANTATRKVSTQSIIVKKYLKISKVERCNMLFITSNNSLEIKEALAHIEEWSTLLITDFPGSTNKDFGLNFVNMNGRQTFEINTVYFDRKKLKYTSELLKLGIRVK